MDIAKLVAVAILVLLAVPLLLANIVKLHDGCPVGQVLIRSVATYECIRQ